MGKLKVSATMQIDAASVHGVQDNGQTLTVLAGGQQIVVPAPFADDVRAKLGVGLTSRPFQPDDPKSHMAKYNNPHIDDIPQPMLPADGAPLHVPGQPMTDDVKKRLGIT